jgi:hypothetical protein
VRLDEFISELDALLEAPYSPYVGAMGRPDADNYNGQVYKNHPIGLGGKDFPYDRDRDNDQWQIGRGRGNRDVQPIRAPLTAKNKGVTKKSGFEEASGTPMNFTMSGKGGQQLGNVAPGMGGDWAVNPARKDDDDEDFMDAMETYGEATKVDPPATNIGTEFVDTSDETLASHMDQIPDEEELTDFDSFPSVLMQVVGSGFGTGLGKTNPSGRGFMQGWTEDYDVLALESVWAEIARIFGL